jgi:hypothetical protein
VDEIDQVRSHAKDGVGFEVVGRDLHDVPRQILGVWPDWAWNGRSLARDGSKIHAFWHSNNFYNFLQLHNSYVHKYEVTLA